MLLLSSCLCIHEKSFNQVFLYQLVVPQGYVFSPLNYFTYHWLQSYKSLNITVTLPDNTRLEGLIYQREVRECIWCSWKCFHHDRKLTLYFSHYFTLVGKGKTDIVVSQDLNPRRCLVMLLFWKWWHLRQKCHELDESPQHCCCACRTSTPGSSGTDRT